MAATRQRGRQMGLRCFAMLWIVTCGGIFATASHAQVCGLPKHIHLAVGLDPATSMTVSFASPECDNPAENPVGAVLYGEDAKSLNHFINSPTAPNRYNAVLPRHHGNYTSDYQHHIPIVGLKPATTYYYRCVVLWGDLARDQDKQNDDEESQRTRILRHSDEDAHKYIDSTTSAVSPLVHSFVTAPSPGEGIVTFAILGDLAQSNRTRATLTKLSKRADQFSAVILAGDLAYATSDDRMWDSWFDLLDGFGAVFRQLPLQVAPGNHDIDLAKSGGAIFVSYENRFAMPSIRPAEMEPFLHRSRLRMDDVFYPLQYDYGNSYYSFVYGPSHHIVLNSYASFEPDSKQHDWLLRELRRVDRSVTPWLLITIHCPIYNTFKLHHHDVQLIKERKILEPIFVEHNVNVVFSGHVHAYMRTHNVDDGNVTSTGPVHIVVGDSGRKAYAPFHDEIPEPWVAVRDATYYGFGAFKILNRTHALWEWVHTGMEDEHNFVFNRSGTPLPHGGSDRLYIKNQIFL